MNTVTLNTLSMLSDSRVLRSRDRFFELLLTCFIEMADLNVAVFSLFRHDEELFRYQINSNDSVLSAYKTNFFSIDPLHPCRINPPGNASRIVTASLDDRDAATMVGTDAQYRFMKKYELYHTLRVVKHLQDNSMFAFWLYRPSDRPRFGNRETVLFTDLLPFIANLIETNLTFNLLDEEISMLLSRSVDRGLIFIDDTFRIIAHNRKAKDYFADINPYASLHEQVRGLSTTIPLRDSFRTSLWTEEKEAYLLTVLTSESYRSLYLLEITPQKPPAIAIASLDILTIREKKIVKQLVKGMKSSQIASLMFISENTVRKHIQNIYIKLGVTNRTDMLKKVMQLPEIPF